MRIETIGIVGAGTMGMGLALDIAAHGMNVILMDNSEKVFDRFYEELSQQLRLVKMTNQVYRQLKETDVMGRIVLTDKLSEFKSVNMVVENVTEDFEIKKRIYKELEKVCQIETVFAVNTSCISITKIGSLIKTPENVVGMHFMNPVPMKKFVEIIRGYHSSDETITKAKYLAEKLNKEAVVVNDFPGFVTNRVLMLMINECAFLVQDNVAKPQDIDKIFRLGFSHEMGPLATGDLIGLDTILNSLIVLYESYNDMKYRPCPLLRKMVDAGLLGRKTGEGFFKY